MSGERKQEGAGKLVSACESGSAPSLRAKH
jgi:hypothetical protein